MIPSTVPLFAQHLAPQAIPEAVSVTPLPTGLELLLAATRQISALPIDAPPLPQQPHLSAAAAHLSQDAPIGAFLPVAALLPVNAAPRPLHGVSAQVAAAQSDRKRPRPSSDSNPDSDRENRQVTPRRDGAAEPIFIPNRLHILQSALSDNFRGCQTLSDRRLACLYGVDAAAVPTVRAAAEACGRTDGKLQAHYHWTVDGTPAERRAYLKTALLSLPDCQKLPNRRLGAIYGFETSIIAAVRIELGLAGTPRGGMSNIQLEASARAASASSPSSATSASASPHPSPDDDEPVASAKSISSMRRHSPQNPLRFSTYVQTVFGTSKYRVTDHRQRHALLKEAIEKDLQPPQNKMRCSEMSDTQLATVYGFSKPVATRARRACPGAKISPFSKVKPSPSPQAGAAQSSPVQSARPPAASVGSSSSIGSSVQGLPSFPTVAPNV